MSSALKALARGTHQPVVAEEEKPDPSELWLALTAIPRPTREVPLPRNIPGTETPVGMIAMWPLKQEEQMAANAEADRYTKRLMADAQKKDEANLGYHHTFTNEVAIQVLFRACRDPKDVKRAAFPSPSDMRRELTTDEIGVLFNNYCTVQSELGPIRAYMSQEETEALILRLVEGGSTFFIDSLSWEAQKTLLLSLASQVLSSWTATYLRGEPLDVSSSVMEYLRQKHGDPEALPSPSEAPEGVEAPVESG